MRAAPHPIGAAKACSSLVLFLAGLGLCSAATTINNTNKFGYGANIGWLNAEADTANGAVVGEYVCSGYLWGANVGWIDLGDGMPANGIFYQNSSAADFGVNHDGVGNLLGFAYAANVGWLNFETNGAPRVDLKTGNLSGFVWSANCGWISLSNTIARVQSDTIQPGTDSDSDGITDAWELSFTNTLTAFTAVSDTDGDGVTDLAEHGADTSPVDPNDFLRIAGYAVVSPGGSDTNTVVWSSTVTRCYVVQYRTNFSNTSTWLDATGSILADPGSNTTRMISFGVPSPERYLRVEARKPLVP